jgi:transcriptional regulator with XRE-family HTH domain
MTEIVEAHRRIHPLCRMLRQLRLAAGLSLADFEGRFGHPAVVLGAYERGDRVPPLHKMDIILECYGWRLQAVPRGQEFIRLPEDIVGELRAIADQLEAAQILAVAA